VANGDAAAYALRTFHDSSIDVRRQAPDNAAVCQPCLKANLFVAPSDDLSRQEVVEYARNLSLLLKRVPPARYDFSRDLRRFTTDELLEALRLNRHRPTPECVARVCGSWLQALIDAGVLSNGARKTARGTQCVAEDGHICLSLAEKTIDDYLHSNGIDLSPGIA
jgi:hypothetical protein